MALIQSGKERYEVLKALEVAGGGSVARFAQAIIECNVYRSLSSVKVEGPCKLRLSLGL